MMSDEAQNRQENMRAEYAAAQASAEHFHSVSWTIKSILWTGNLALFGFALDQLAKPADLSCATRLLIATAAVMGIVTAFIACAWSRQCGRAIKYKYDLCKQLEPRLGMTHHTRVEGTSKEPVWTTGLGRDLTYVMTGVLVAAWGFVLFLLAWGVVLEFVFL